MKKKIISLKNKIKIEKLDQVVTLSTSMRRKTRSSSNIKHINEKKN